MPHAIALRKTYLKASPEDSTTLDEKHKILIEPGQEFAYLNALPIAGNHYHIKLASALGTGKLQDVYAYAPHVKLQENQEIRLAIDWDSQINSRYPKQAYRMCFSCAIWMTMSYISAAFAKKFKTDDDYLNYMLSFGDTTEAWAHLSALKTAGFQGQFSQTAGLKDIIKSLEAGLPCAIGVLHHGTVKYPSGGGHWICIGGVSSDRTQFLAFDPYGSLVDANGPYSGAVENGNGYWLPSWVLDGRWTVNTPDGDGYLMTFLGN